MFWNFQVLSFPKHFLSGMHFKGLKTPKTKWNKIRGTPCMNTSHSYYTDRQRKLGNFCFGIGAAKCSLSQLPTVLGKQCWEAVVRNSLIGVVVAAVVRKSFIGSCYSAFYCGCRAGISPLAGAGLSLRAQRSHGKCIMTTFMHRKQG